MARELLYINCTSMFDLRNIKKPTNFTVAYIYDKCRKDDANEYAEILVAKCLVDGKYIVTISPIVVCPRVPVLQQ